MRLRTTKGFYDKKACRYRPTGEEFDVTEARATEILAAGVAEVVEDSADSAPPEEPEQKSVKVPAEKPKRRPPKG
jgi:hypothetical protein